MGPSHVPRSSREPGNAAPWWLLGVAAALGASLGAVVRWWVDQGLGGWSTLAVVNTAGTALLLATRHRLPEPWRTLVTTGFCGGLTTMSAMAVLAAEQTHLFRVPLRLAWEPDLVALAVLVAAGGALGGVVRWAVDGALRTAHPGSIAWGIVACNVAGSALAGHATASAGVGGLGVALLVAGMAGALTTFSTAFADCLDLVRTGFPGRAIAYAVGTLAGCFGAASAGMWWAGMNAPLT